MHNNRFILTLTLCLVAVIATAQQMLTPGLTLQANTNSSLSEKYTLSETGVGQIASGNINENIRTDVSVGYNIKIALPLSIGFSGRYNYNNETITGLPNNQMNWDNEHHSFKGTMNVMFLTLLFHKPLVTLASVNAEASKWGVERVSGMGVSMLMLESSKETTLGVGGILLINTSSRIPFFPFAMYRHVYSPRWTLNITYPFLSMQYTPTPEQTISAGFTIDTYSYWIRPELLAMPKTVFYRRSLLKTGINYDYKLTPSLTLTAQAGWEYTMSGGLYTSNGRHKLMDMNHANGLYGHIGISYKPKSKSQGTNNRSK